MKISSKAYAMLYVGQTIGLELDPPKDGLRSWVAVYPCIRKTIFVGNDAVEQECDYGGVGNPIFKVLRFNIATSAVEQPTYDYDHYMSDVRRLEVTSKDGFDPTVAALEELLESWGIEPQKLGPLSDDYPIF